MNEFSNPRAYDPEGRILSTVVIARNEATQETLTLTSQNSCDMAGRLVWFRSPDGLRIRLSRWHGCVVSNHLCVRI
jgi:hypothetical protein